MAKHKTLEFPRSSQHAKLWHATARISLSSKSRNPVERAVEFAETFVLLGYDSVQLAAACEILSAAPSEAAFSCFDNRLNKAARVLGLDVAWPISE